MTEEFTRNQPMPKSIPGIEQALYLYKSDIENSKAAIAYGKELKREAKKSIHAAKKRMRDAEQLIKEAEEIIRNYTKHVIDLTEKKRNCKE